MSASNDPFRLHSFTPSIGDWCAVHAAPDAPDGADPFTLESIIGWAVIIRPDGDFEIAPVIGGEYIEIDGDALGIYQRADLARPDVRARVVETCEMIRGNARRHRGCGAP